MGEVKKHKCQYCGAVKATRKYLWDEEHGGRKYKVYEEDCDKCGFNRTVMVLDKE